MFSTDLHPQLFFWQSSAVSLEKLSRYATLLWGSQNICLLLASRLHSIPHCLMMEFHIICMFQSKTSGPLLGYIAPLPLERGI